MYKIIEDPGITTIDACINSSEVLAQLTQVEKAELASQFEWCSLAADEILFKKGEAAEGLFIVASGRLEAFVSTDTGVNVLGRIGPGELVGEMALLSGAPRGASVRAVRDSVLLRLTTEKFRRLAVKNPEILFSLTRILVKRMEVKAPKKPRAPSNPVVALVPVTKNAPVDVLADKLAAELKSIGAAAVLRNADVETLLGAALTGDASSPNHYKVTRWLQDIESKNNSLLFVANNEDTAWSRRCIREADTVLLVANANEAPLTGGLIEKLRENRAAGGSDRYELAMIHPEGTKMPSGTRKWLDTFPVDAHHHIILNRKGDVRRLSRFLSGRAVAVALAGGAGRGFAHIGAARALEEAKIPIDFVCGTSMGSYIAGLFACLHDIDTIERLGLSTLKCFFDPGLPFISMLSGRKWVSHITESLGGDIQIEDLWLPYFCMATSLSAKAVTMKKGSAVTAIRCSSGVPGMYPPVEVDGEFLVDGGMLNNLPAQIAQEQARGKTIAVNVMQPADPKLMRGLLHYASTWDKFRVLNPLRTGWGVPIMEVSMQGMFLGTFSANDPISRMVDLWIDPPMAQYGLMDPTKKTFLAIVRTGYEEARRRLADWKERDPEVALL